MTLHSHNAPNTGRNWLEDLRLYPVATSYHDPLHIAENFPMLGSIGRRLLTYILEDYRGVPLSQKSYASLKHELKLAGLLPEQVFVGQSTEDSLRRDNHYMSRIVQSWQKMTARNKI